MSDLKPIVPDWNRCPGPAVCLGLCHAKESSKDALVVAQAQAIDRLTGGRYDQPAPPELEAVEVAPAPSLVAVLEAALADDATFRKPPRVAAPRILRALADAGYLNQTEDVAS